MVKLDSLPPELLCTIAEECEVYALYGRNSGTKYRYHAFLARTCRYLHKALNPFLYRRHIKNNPPLDSCILWAARGGRLETVKLAHAFGASLDTNGTRDDSDLRIRWEEIPGRWRFFASPLHLAFASRHRHIVEYLIENGASPHVPSRDFLGSGISYVLRGVSDIEDMKMLVRHGANLLAEGIPALPSFARAKYDPELLCLFLEQDNPEVTAQALRCGAQYKIPELFYGALKKPELNAAFVEALLARPDVEATCRDKDGRLPIQYAAASGAIDIVDLLLQQPGVDLSVQDCKGRTLIHYACDAEGDPAAMRSLIQRTLDAGVPVNQPSPTGTALFHAVKHNNLDTALFLLSKDADPTVDPSADEFDWTMLHHCLYKKDRMETRTQLVKKIASHGVDLRRYAQDFPDADLSEDWMHIGPPLYIAAVYAESIECMKILLDAGADPSNAVMCIGRGDVDVEDGDIHPTLCALFGVYSWSQPGTRLNQMREQVCLLLERGYSLDYGGTGDFAGCPLDWATRKLKLPKAVS
ncbi:Ankyrin repeat protein [Aspergillus sp. HF37]|nr:Ankyrin repeat protein [Aspergillus sp. HF37]